jgi:hypothetical protein|tara:strand:- start:168 stop:878 length:711 start_codon:yes stop_codon:yes gene_type:complete
MIDNPFSEYRNKHLGQSAILFGSGPTILDFDIQQVPSEVLRCGVNDQIFLDLDLDYWFMGDAMPQIPSKFYDRFEAYNDYTPSIQKFIRFPTWPDEREIIVPGWGKVPRNGQLPLGMKNSKYYMCDAGGNPDTCLFKKDISEGNLTAVGSICFEALQFLLFSGVKTIYLVGHDCDYNNGTFSKYMIGKHQGAGYWLLRYWPIVKNWISQNYPDAKIYSVNPVALDIFPLTTNDKIQ